MVQLNTIVNPSTQTWTVWGQSMLRVPLYFMSTTYIGFIL